MKASYVLPMAAVALLGAGALYAPVEPLERKIVSVCTERDPIYAKKGTEYVNALGVGLTQEELADGALVGESNYAAVFDTGNGSTNGDLAIAKDPYPKPTPDANGRYSLTSRIDAVEAALIGTGQGAEGGADNSLYKNTVDAIKAIQTSETVGNLKTATSNVQAAVQKTGTVAGTAAETDSIAKRAVAVGALLSEAGTSDPFVPGGKSLSEQTIARQKEVMTGDDTDPAGTTVADVIDTPTGNETITPLETRITKANELIGVFYKQAYDPNSIPNDAEYGGSVYGELSNAIARMHEVLTASRDIEGSYASLKYWSGASVPLTLQAFCKNFSVPTYYQSNDDPIILRVPTITP